MVLPTTTTGLILYYGDPFLRLTDRGTTAEPTLGFNGQQTRAVRVVPTGRTGIAIVSFRPWGASAFLRVPQRDLRDRNVSLDDVAGRRWADRWRHRLLAAGDERCRVDLLWELLGERCRPDARSPLAVAAVAAIRRSRGAEPVHELADRLGVSRRHLGRVFRATIGLGPKRFAELERFQAALRGRALGWTWAEIAAACGYCDQAHLVHAWRAITGESPGRLLSAPPTPLARYFNTPPMSRFYKTTYL